VVEISRYFTDAGGHTNNPVQHPWMGMANAGQGRMSRSKLSFYPLFLDISTNFGFSPRFNQGYLHHIAS
jgi:hypothetical protein